MPGCQGVVVGGVAQDLRGAKSQTREVPGRKGVFVGGVAQYGEGLKRKPEGCEDVKWVVLVGWRRK